MSITFFINVLKNELLPKRCSNCRSQIYQTYHNQLTKYFCNNCLIDLIADSKLKKFHFRGLKNTDNSYYIWTYNKITSKLIKDYKYRKNYYLAKVFAEFIFYSLRNYNILEEKHLHNWDFLCSVPSTKKLIRSKRFNHMILLSRKVSKKINTPFRLDTIKNTASRKKQSLLNRKQRKINIKNAFMAKNCRDKKILLLDDITSTTYTISEAYSSLYNAGAKSVDVLILANNNLQ